MGRECGRAVQKAVEMAASSVAAAAVETAAAAAAAAVARAVSVVRLEVRQVAVWAAVLRGEVGMMEEQMSAAAQGHSTHSFIFFFFIRSTRDCLIIECPVHNSSSMT